MKNITMADVARKADVSKSTVSQYINQRFEYMSADTREKVKRAIEELNYMPNSIARSLKRKTTSTVGVIVANILHTFSTQVIRAIEDRCRMADVHVIVCNADDDPLKERKYIEMLRAKQVDGLIIFPTPGNRELYQELVAAQYPIVFVDRVIEDAGVSTLLLDNERAAELLVDLLYGNGYRRIAFITSSLNSRITPRMERLSGYQKALQKHGLPIVEERFGGAPPEGIPDLLEQMFDTLEKPDALICGNDLTLLETLKFVNGKGWKVPKDIALASIDEVPYSEVYQPPLTTVSQPVFEIGTAACELLLKKIAGTDGETPEIILFSPELIIREST